ncbi:MAG: hypothetical protein JXQ29_05840 [Planctomycetes bacterium]|nr:hypothetical protein [Planctomycetota bacterium]
MLESDTAPAGPGLPGFGDPNVPPNTFFLTIPPAHELCLALYRRSDFARLFLGVKPEACFVDRGVQAYMRVVVGRSRLVCCDKQGRLYLPPPLREECGIHQEVLVIGAWDHVEIWDVERWQRYLESHREDIPELAARIHGSAGTGGGIDPGNPKN